MDQRADYLTLWVHYESRGYDDKNRMISSSALLLSVSGVLFGAGITWVTASPHQPIQTMILAAMSICAAVLSVILIGFFAGHADRNFRSAELIKKGSRGRTSLLSEDICQALSNIDEERKQPPQSLHLFGSGKWLSTLGKGASVGRIFNVFYWISWAAAVPPALLFVYALLAGRFVNG
jgi:hypothetical protein